MPTQRSEIDRRPFLTIVTVHYKDFDRLSFTFSSIKSLPGLPLTEWIVVDGGSRPANEKQRRLISEIEQFAARMVSEPDEGVYDAMNKGFSMANGEYILFLNAGDGISPGFSPAELMRRLDGARPDMIWGRSRFEYPDGTRGVKKLRGPKWMAWGMPVCHQAVLFLNSRFTELQFDTRFKIAADYELMARALKSGATVHLVEEVISDYEAGGISQRDRKASLREESIVREEHYGVPSALSSGISTVKLILWSLSDFSPRFNRLWRKRV